MEVKELQKFMAREIERLKTMKNIGCSTKALETELEVITKRIEAEIRGEVDFYGL